MKSMTLEQLRPRLLPLLPHLEALLVERHVSRAAKRLGITQPSMSRALASARELLDDELLVRTSSGLALTARGEETRVAVERILGEVGNLAAPSEFSARHARGSLRIAATDYVSQVYLPRVIAALRRHAPQLSLELVAWSSDTLRLLEEDEVQLGVNPPGPSPRSIHRRSMAEDRYVTIVARANPLARGPARLDLARFVTAAHVLVATEGSPRGVVDRALARQRKARQVAVRARDFATAAALVGATDMIATLPERVALAVKDRFELVLKETPVALPPIRIDLIWHERRQRDPQLSWVRSLFPQHLPRRAAT